jgi:hypothetical protein
MGAKRKCLWMIAAIAALPAPAAAADVCTALQRIVASAREPVPFDSVRRAAAAGEIIVPGFRLQECRVSAAELFCHQRRMSVMAFDAWPNPLPCPGFVADQPIERREWHQDRGYAYTAPGVRIEYWTRCSACAGPGSGYFSARPVPGGAVQ